MDTVYTLLAEGVNVLVEMLTEQLLYSKNNMQNILMSTICSTRN